MRSGSRSTSVLLLAALTALLSARPARAAAAVSGQQAIDLSSATLEELMNLPITSAARKEQRAFDVAAAIYVITRNDIQASGLLSVPEILRLAPGVQVARIDGNKWAVSVRGFNSRWSNKLLVMIDGRTVYTRLESGVAWDIVTPPVEDIDRIEIVRGPGGSVWGANAVDGVINILTRPATDTQGGTVRATAGTPGAADVFAEYGGTLGRAAVRAGLALSTRGDSTLPDSTDPGGDGVHDVSAHVRSDWSEGRDAVTVQGDVQVGRSGTRLPLATGPIPPADGWPASTWEALRHNANVLARWKRAFDDRSSVQVQGFVDYGWRDEPIQTYRATTLDLDVEYRTQRGRHDLLGGGAYRLVADRIVGSVDFNVTPERQDLVVVNSFAQDEIRLAGDAVHAIVGAKLEHDTFGGWGLQPSVRALWKIDGQQRFWAAWSRAIRSPARLDRGLNGRYPSFLGPDGMPTVLTVHGSPDYQSETMRSSEAGYRITAGQHVSFDVSAFVSRHDRLVTFEPLSATVVFSDGQPYLDLQQQLSNNLGADTRGAEVATRWTPRAGIEVNGSVSLFHLTPDPRPDTRDADAASADGNAPGHQWRLGTTVAIGPRGRLTTNLFGVGRLVARGVPAYTRLDAAFDWTLRRDLSLVAAGQNLAGGGHIEFFGLDSAASQILLDRTGSVRIMWRF